MNFEKELQRSKELEAKALEACNSEPIEIPGLIQSYGALLAFDFDSLAITYASNNIGDYINFNPAHIFELSVRDLFKSEDFHAIANIASHSSAFRHREQVKIMVLNECEIDLSLFRVDKYVVLEFIPVGQPLSTIQINSHLKWTLDTIRKLETVDEILAQSVQGLKNITEYDRVMAYRFHPDDSGEVVAEVNNGKMDSYLGLRFPAYDIPPIARELFLKISIRHISSTSDEGISIKAAQKDLPPLNLSLAILRGNSPIHNQYLRNMGVASSLTLPIVINNKLWGLFALHNKDAKKLTSEITYSAELVGQLVSMVLEQQLERNAEKRINKLHMDGEEFVTLNQNSLYLRSFWKKYADKLKALIKCDGVAYQIDKKILIHGDCPTIKAIHKITKKIKDNEEQEIHHFTNLNELHVNGIGNSRGMLALQINKDHPNIFIYFFRNAVEQNIAWAGNPKKDVVVEDSQVRLHPRSSFNHFTELNKGQSELWDAETIAVAEVAVKTFKRAVMVEKATSERLKIVVRELNHRLRNVLTLVRSISRQTAENEKSVVHYVDSLEQRILALADANSLLTSSSYNSVDLKMLLLKVIPPLCNHSDNIDLEGPSIMLAPDTIPMMVLIIHELTTNAVKYGSLSMKEGKLNVSWKKENSDLLLEWKELDGPSVTPPNKVGFGTSIIENALKYEFSGISEVDFQENGLYAKFKIPGDLIGEDKNNVFVLEQVQDANEPERVSKARCINILILEDDFLNARDMKKVVSHPQVNQVDTFSNQEEALAALSTTTYNLALLDVNLKKETCIKVASECKRKNIPFYYITGYGSSFLNESTFPKAPVILKPIQTQKLKEIVNGYVY
ncbi:GAF domain-containing protein [Flagellimonas sp. 389]|uniref:HWE histidine kinase domain-containing protein n=1 Tax=Flagellimonas sp. 389 TaxID=2835862 RepID=UPI001BD67F59|nr:HWE histidine kinase domain-containing protein [Flagellimonas sp. 389]MBS9461430.1 GAF domain-containing protein [Flagellimonas sp. 389]